MTDQTIPLEEEFQAEGQAITERVSVAGSDLIKTVQSLLREVAVRKITVQDKTGRTLLEIPLYAGIVGTLLIGSWTVLALVAAWFAEVSILIERDKASDADSPTVVAEAAERTVTNVKETVSTASTGLGEVVGGAAGWASVWVRKAADSIESRMAPTNGNGHAAVVEAPVAEAVAEPAQCAATTKAGSRCKRQAMPGSDYCSMHQVA